MFRHFVILVVACFHLIKDFHNINWILFYLPTEKQQIVTWLVSHNAEIYCHAEVKNVINVCSNSTFSQSAYFTFQSNINDCQAKLLYT